jgi:hypothetical protein
MIGNIAKARGSVCTTIFTEKWPEGEGLGFAAARAVAVMEDSKRVELETETK